MNYDDVIKDNLMAIAENEQRVYNAGYEAGKEAGGGGDTSDFVTKEEFQDYVSAQNTWVENTLTEFETYADENYASKEDIGDIGSALADLHDYSEALKGGEE